MSHKSSISGMGEPVKAIRVTNEKGLLLIMVEINMEKLFIYLVLAKPAPPGQFDLLVSSQSKANASKYFCLFQCAAQNKSSDSISLKGVRAIPEYFLKTK